MVRKIPISIFPSSPPVPFSRSLASMHLVGVLMRRCLSSSEESKSCSLSRDQNVTVNVHSRNYALLKEAKKSIAISTLNRHALLRQTSIPSRKATVLLVLNDNS
eukprot:scaffold10330_cov98-Cylindrotheca_fusiformis.AAC.2